MTSPESNDPRSQLIIKDSEMTKLGYKYTIGTLENDSVNIVISSDKDLKWKKFDRVKISKYY